MIGFFSRQSTAITFDDLQATPEVIFIEHDFGGPTGNVPMWCNGADCQPLRYNPVDGLHHGFIVRPEGTTCAIEITDFEGDLRTASSATTTEPSEPTAVRTRYVSPTGSGTNYTEGDPGDLTAALGSEAAGDHIILLDGIYYAGDLVCTQDNVVIKAADGANPIIRGWRETPESWVSGGPAGLWWTTNYDANAKMVHGMIDGKLEHLAFWNTVADLQTRTNGWTIEGGRLYIWNVGDPTTVEVRVPSIYNDGLLITSDNCQVKGIIFEGHGAGASINADGLRLSGVSGCLVKDCTFRYIYNRAMQIQDSTNVVIDNVQLQNNMKYITQDDIKMNDPDRPDEYRMQNSCKIYVANCSNVTIRDCGASGMSDGFTLLKDAADGLSNYNVAILRCVCNTMIGNPMDIDGTHKRILRLDNLGVNTNYFISMALGDTGPYWFVNDRFINVGYISLEDQKELNEFSAVATKFNLPRGDNKVGQIVCINCTSGPQALPSAAFANDSRAWHVNSGYSMAHTYMRNCIWDTHGRPFEHEDNDGSVYDMDYDIWWSDNDASLANLWRWDGTYYSSWSSFKTASGQESNGYFQAPGLDGSGLPTSPVTGVYEPGVTFQLVPARVIGAQA